jgi:hypothetical protein
MPNVNDIEYAYGRVYRYIKPDSTDPGTWRLSSPETGTGSPGGGGPGGGITDVDAIDPIQASQTPTKVTISLDIQSLGSRV